MPPKSEVPGADEESPVPGFEAGEGEMQAPRAAEESRSDADRSILPAPDADRRPEPLPEEKPAAPDRSRPVPADEKPATEKPDDANLFDESSLRRRTQERLAQLGQTAVQQERLRREALRQQATRLARPAAPAGPVRQATHVEPAP